MAASPIIAKIGEVAAGTALERFSGTEITFFKPVGVAVQDLAAASVVLQKAEVLSIGTIVDLKK